MLFPINFDHKVIRVVSLHTRLADRSLVDVVHQRMQARSGLTAAGGEMDAPDLFNLTIFRDLQARIGPAKMAALLEIFKRTTAEGFVTLDRADSADREACLHQVTHSLVSTAGTLGFDRLSAESRSIMEGRQSGVAFGDQVAALRALADLSLDAWQAAAARESDGLRSKTAA